MKMLEKTRAHVEIETELWKNAQKLAVDREETNRQFVEAALRAYIAQLRNDTETQPADEPGLSKKDKDCLRQFTELLLYAPEQEAGPDKALVSIRKSVLSMIKDWADIRSDRRPRS